MIATRRILVIGNSGYTSTSLCSNLSRTCDTTVTTTTLAGESYTITRTHEAPEYYDYERCSRIAKIKEIREGWLKPNKELSLSKLRSKTNHLPRIRDREKKQIFMKAA